MYSYFGPSLPTVFPDPRTQIENSLRFDGSGDYLNHTPITSNRKTYTFSCWIKRSTTNRYDYIFSSTTPTVTTEATMRIGIDTANDNDLGFYQWSGSFTWKVTTTSTITDNDWHHIVLSVDTTQATPADRVKIYLDGNLTTHDGTSTYMNQNDDTVVNFAGYTHGVGGAWGNYFKGQIAEVHFIDGQALSYTTFADKFPNGVYAPKKVSADLTYGNNGFHLDFSQSSSTTNAFNSITYSGNSVDQSIKGVGFKPDLVWLKSRTNTYVHGLFDTVQGGGYHLCSNLTNAQIYQDIDGYLDTFDNDGFTLVAGSRSSLTWNSNTQNFISWCWKAGGNSNTYNVDDVGYATASAAGLDAGTITPTGASVNTAAGFSIVKYTGNGTAGATVSHGLNSAPDVIIIKDTTSGTRTSDQWPVFHSATGATGNLVYLHKNTGGIAASVVWNDTNPTANVFTLGNWGGINYTGDNFIAYCWHSVEGYSKFGSYVGNGSSNGPIINTGFRPAFIMIKNTTPNTSDDWHILDNARDFANPITYRLKANLADTESSTDTAVDFLADGFQLINTAGARNASNNTYIYMAFADTSPNLGMDRTANNNDFSVDGNFTDDDQLVNTPNIVFESLTTAASGVSLSDSYFVATMPGGAQNTKTRTNDYLSGKVYIEFLLESNSSVIGLTTSTTAENFVGISSDSLGWFLSGGAEPQAWTNGAQNTSYEPTYQWVFLGSRNLEIGHIVGLAIDTTAHTIRFYRNGSSYGDIVDYSGWSTSPVYFALGNYASGQTYRINFGQDPGFAGGIATPSNPYSDSRGDGEFYYEPPSGYLALKSIGALNNLRTRQS